MADDSKIVPLGAATETMGRALARASSQRRMDVILSRENALGLVRALPTEDLYYLIKDVGLADAGLLASMATPAQYRGFMDLEIIELVLRAGLLIVDRREEEEAPRPPPRPGPESLTWETTSCYNFYIAYTEPDSVESKALRRMLEEIYAIDAFGASRLLSSVRVELDSELSETALQVRSARMEDMGFPPMERALEIYAHRDPSSELPAQPAPPETIPGFQLAQIADQSFLHRVSAKILGVGPRTHLDRGLLYLTNMALVADRVATHDDEGVREVTERVHATLSLALDHLAAGDEEVAAGILGSRALKSLFQVGFTLTLQLQHTLKRALSEAGLEDERRSAPFDEPERGAIDCLLARRPTLALGVLEAERRGWPGDPEAYLEEGEAPLGDLPEGQRAIASRADLALLERVIEGVVAAVGLLGPEGALHHQEEEAPALAGRIATLLVARAAGHEGGLEALDLETARQGLAALFEPSGALVSPPWRALAQDLLAAHPGGQHLVARAFARFIAEARPVYLAGDRPDPRYLSVLWTQDQGGA